MLFSTQERVERILETIDRLGIVKIKHLLEIHDLKSYKNACRVVRERLRPFIVESFFQKEKVMYLNKKGRDLIGSEKADVQINHYTVHGLLRNEVYIYFKCPYDWQNEYSLETHIKPSFSDEIIFNGLTLGEKKKIVCDAVFNRNGYMHLIEVDNERKMLDNQKKIETYREILPSIRDKNPILYFFTKTESRKRKLKEWLQGIRHEVYTFDEIK